MAGPLSAGSIRLDTSKLDKLAANLHPVAEQLVAKAAFDVEALAKAAAPVKTGNLKSSIAAQPRGPFSWVVRVGASYGAYVEFGTSKMDARPYLGPAVASVRKGFVAACKALFS